ncbi:MULTISPECIES: thioredoxin family protein [Flavobacterium]|jgi:thioredoxin-related protein|uniref:Thioredoxin family protein n=1 Tax=Flavobacterium cupriresistens TaxID=2893885 RepID=A0ABU4RG95_9FLAO|nr:MULTISPECIES: thioredoxin family protein [unclassified Flavobacterium]KLT71502.1 thioredoxin [Flavobacterium sp. ABG]MDX6190873.1 thioredoxin family protein [Flavobacterium sp. Fl-318]UFH43955.1 thioredoxin family protein [Flavobacterium sp. F-323]
MKKIFLIAFFLVGAFVAQAQELKWHTDVKEAIAISNKENKPMLLFFTGSDWCGWCIRLQNEVLKTAEFSKWASQNVVLVELDYPRRTPQTPELKNQNNELQQAFGIQGFPTIYFTSAESKDGKVNFKGLGHTGYVAGGPTAWLAVAEGIVHPKKS